jgi:hypothetical protein
MQEWVKLGHLFAPDGGRAWQRSHASVPILDRISGDAARILYSARGADQRSYTGAVTVDLATREVLDVEPEPLLGPGRPGFFDADGSMATDLVRSDHGALLYYIGWNRAHDVPFRNAVGMAVSTGDGATFARYSAGPILDRSIHDPCFVASCCVRPVGAGYRMWYLSCIDWERLDTGEFRHHYHLKEATSDDGLIWRRAGKVAIDFRYPGEYAISVPRVVVDRDTWKMWYSYRAGPGTETYRIGYAESPDGDRWERRDDVAGLDPAPGAWDGEMVCYPYVFDHGGDRFMLYNGDGYGRTGFGLARLEEA